MKSQVARHLLCKVLGSMSCRSQCCIAESLWGVYSAIARGRNRTCSGRTKKATEQSSEISPGTTDLDYSGHLTAASLTIRRFLCTAHLDAAHALLLKVMRSFDCRIAHSRSSPLEGSTADIEDQGCVCLEGILSALPISALTARCREVCASESGSGRFADADPGQRNSLSGRSADNIASPSGLILALLGRLLGDACALLSTGESCNLMTASNCIRGSAYGPAIGVTVLTAASESHFSSAANTSSSAGLTTALSSLHTEARPIVSIPQSLLKRVGAISRYLLGVFKRGRVPKGPFLKTCELRKIRGLISAQRALVTALETALRSSAPLSAQKAQYHSQSQSSARQHSSPESKPHLSHAEVKVLKSSALSMLAACDYLSVGPITSQMFSSANPLLAARPPSVTSIALAAVRCVCQTLGAILSFTESVTGEFFEFAKTCFHSMIGAASAFSLTLQSYESRFSSSHSALTARMDVAGMWSTILSFLVKFAKGLPTSLQSGAQSLVPQKVGSDGRHDSTAIHHPQRRCIHIRKRLSSM